MVLKLLVTRWAGLLLIISGICVGGDPWIKFYIVLVGLAFFFGEVVDD